MYDKHLAQSDDCGRRALLQTPPKTRAGGIAGGTVQKVETETNNSTNKRLTRSRVLRAGSDPVPADNAKFDIYR